MQPVTAGLIGALITLACLALVIIARRGVSVRRNLTTARPGSVAGDQLLRIVASLPGGAMVIGSHDEVLAANEEADKMGLARGSRIGFTELLGLVRSTRIAGTPYKGLIEREREPGREVIELTGRVIPLEDGMLLVVASDESAHRRIDAVRRDFVANVSHELKTPIGAIGILSEAIEAARDEPEEVARFALRLQDESARLSELVSQIIDLSRLQSSDPMLSREVVDIDEVIDEAFGRSHELAAKRGVNLIRARSDSALVMGDRWQLTDAVTNLVQNALVYSDKHARVAVSVVHVSDEGDEFVEVKVADNGIGISQEDQERIFERFYRVDYGRSRESGGTGLGLSIVRHIAVAHGGSVRVWSRQGQGSTFTLRIPAWMGGEPVSPDDDNDEE